MINIIKLTHKGIGLSTCNIRHLFTHLNGLTDLTEISNQDLWVMTHLNRKFHSEKSDHVPLNAFNRQLPHLLCLMCGQGQGCTTNLVCLFTHLHGCLVTSKQDPVW